MEESMVCIVEGTIHLEVAFLFQNAGFVIWKDKLF